MSEGLLANASGQSKCVSLWVVPDPLQPHGLQPTRLLCPWDFLDKDTGEGCHFLLRDKLYLQMF